MQSLGGKLVRRRNSPVRENAILDRDARRPEMVRPRVELDRRSKQQIDRPSGSNAKGKAKARYSKPATKKRRGVCISDSDSSAEEIANVDPDWSHGHAFAEEEETDYESNNTDNRSQSPQRRRHSHGKAQKKPMTLDLNGMPWGMMKQCLSDDIKKYAKSLDATANWESQPAAERQQLFKRLYREWDMLGQSYKLNNKSMAPIITKVLITTRWRLNTLIDAGQPKPTDVTDEQWDTLMRRRKSEDSKVISDHMRSISQGRASKTTHLKAIEQDAIMKLTLQHHHKPYATEITEEVGQEYNRLQQEKRNASVQKGNDMEEVRNRVLEIESSVVRLDDKVGNSQQRVEDMLNAILSAQGVTVAAATEVIAPLPVSPVRGDVLPVVSADNMPDSPTKRVLPDALPLIPETCIAMAAAKSTGGL